MAFPEDPEDLEVGFAFGHSAAEDPTGLSFEVISPTETGDPGPALAPTVITAGRPGNASTTLPTRIQMGGLRNDDGEFSPLNPTGPRHGTLKRGTPMRLTVDVGSGQEPLATAAQLDWTPTVAGPGIDRRVPIDALGVLSLLGRDDERLSPLTRLGRSSSQHASFTGWWPCESGNGPITSIASGLTGGNPALITTSAGQSVSAGAPDGLLGATGALDLSSGATVRGPLNAVRNPLAGLWAFECAVNIGSQALGDRFVFYAPNGSRYLAFSTANQDAVAVVVTAGGTTNTLTGTATIADGKWHWVSIVVNATLFGTDAAVVTLYIDGTAVTMSGGPVTITSNEAAEFAISGVDGLSQVMHWRGSYLSTNGYRAFIAHNGTEDAGSRIARLFAAAGYPIEVASLPGAALMGPQQSDTLMGIVREAEATDEGMLIELRDGRVSYLYRQQLENQSGRWTLDFEDTAGVWPDYSDLFLRNIITAQSPDGKSATVEAKGDLSPDEIGRRSSSVARNPYLPDANLIHSAGYALARATLTRPRVHIGLNLHGEQHLGEQWLARFIGSRVVVTNLPEQQQQDLGPGDVDVIIVGVEQYLDAGIWTVDLMCESYELYDVGVTAQDLPINDFDPEQVGWYEYDSCVLASGVTETSSSWSITCSPADSSAVNDFPRRHYIGGELVSVTASTGGTNPTWAVTRSVNGVVKAHGAGDSATLADPLILTLS